MQEIKKVLMENIHTYSKSQVLKKNMMIEVLMKL